MHLFGIYVLVGSFSGLLAGLLGLGGGIVIVPALAGVFSHYQLFPQEQIMHMAIGTSLVTIMVTFISSLITHHKNESIRWDYVKLMWPLLIIGAIIGANVAQYLHTHFLKMAFALFLFFISFRLLFTKPVPAEKNPPATIFVRVAAVAAGTLSGILGIGGGALLIPFFLRCKLSMREAAGTAVAAGLTISVVASVSFMLLGLSAIHLPWSTGYIYWPAFIGIAIPSIILAPLGANIAYKLPTQGLKRLFAVVLFLIGLDML